MQATKRSEAACGMLTRIIQQVDELCDESISSIIFYKYIKLEISWFLADPFLFSRLSFHGDLRFIHQDVYFMC